MWFGRGWYPDFGHGGNWFEARLTLHREGDGVVGSAQLRELRPRARGAPAWRDDLSCAEIERAWSVSTDAHGRRMLYAGVSDGAWEVMTGYFGSEDVVSTCGEPGIRQPRRWQIVMRVDGTDRAEGRAPWWFTLTRSSCAP